MHKKIIAPSQTAISLRDSYGRVRRFAELEEAVDLGRWTNELQSWGHHCITSYNPSEYSLRDEVLLFMQKVESHRIRNEIFASDADPAIYALAIRTLEKFKDKISEDFMEAIHLFCDQRAVKACKIIYHTDSPNYTTIPSALHVDDNQDSIAVGTLKNTGTVVVVADGVSSSYDINGILESAPDGKPVNGGKAARKVTQNLKDFFEQHEFPEDFDPTNKDAIVTLRAAFLEKLDAVCDHILTEFDSATTLDIALEIPFQDTRYLVNFTIGDSQTMVKTPDGKWHMLNICENFLGYQGDAIVHLDKAPPLTYNPNRNITNTGGNVMQNGFTNHEAGYQCSAVVKELPKGSVYMVGSDGFFDMCSTYLYGRGKTQLDYCELPHIWALCDATLKLNLNEADSVRLLTSLAIILSTKTDDITLFMKKV